MLRRVMVVAAAALAAAAPVSAAAAASAPRAAPVPSAPGAAPRTGAATVLSDVGGTFCEQFYCANREECTSWDKVNDGYSDCSDGSDENCYGSNCCAVINAATKRSASASVVADVDGGIVTVLTPGFRCGDGSCIDSSLVNNGYTDCRDASDEPSVCPSYEFDCQNGSQCIPYDKVNDGYTDCATGADEPCNGIDCCSYLPHSEASPEDAVRGFRCNDGQCVDRNAFNNGYTECADGSDENNGGGDGDGGDGGSPTDGWSSGDPHLTTLDGLYYDFQALGFFQLCASADVTIHTCQQPWVLFPQAVAVNHAVAVGRAGEGVFQVAFNTAAGTFETRINGSPVTLGNGQSAAVGTAGTVTRSFETYVYTGSGGDLVRLETSDWAQWVNVQYHPRSRPAATSGLCGTADGNSANDFTARDGTVYSPFSTEYAGTQSGLTWRVPEGDLLLSGVTCPSELPDYAPYYLSANNFRLAVGKKPAAAAAAQKRAAPSAQQAFDMDAFVAEHLAEARACLTEEERNIVDFGVDGSPEQTLVLQKLLDLIVIHNPTNGTATVGPCETDKRVTQQAYFSSPSCFNVNYCGGHGRCASNGQSCVCDAGWAGADCSVPVSDEFVGLCNGAGQGSCASAVIQTSGGTATIRWGPDGTCQ